MPGTGGVVCPLVDLPPAGHHSFVAFTGIGSMDVQDWESRLASVHDELYEDLVTTADCGAFDGGCIVIATAIQRVIGGELVAVVRSDDIADHAAVYQGGMLWDYAGPLPPGAFIERLNRDEMRHTSWRSVGYRPIREEDLADAYRGEALVDRLSQHFRKMLPETGDTPAPKPFACP